MATSFYARYPSASASANPANGSTGAVAPTTATEVGFVDNSTGFLQPFSGPTAATGPNVNVSGFPIDPVKTGGSITVVDSGTTSTPQLNGQNWITGTPTAGSFVTFTSPSQATGQLEISGTWAGTLQSEVSVDGGVTYVAHSIHQIGSPNFIASFTGNVIGSINLAGKTHWRIRATAAMTGSATIYAIESINATSIYVANAVKIVDGTATTAAPTLAIKAASVAPVGTDAAVVVALSPNGAQSTAALQTTGNTSLASIDSKTPALGQQVASASSPVVLTAAQLTTLTPLSSVTVTQATGTNLHAVIDNFPGTQPVSGTVTVTQATGTNLHTVVDSGSITVTQATGTNLHAVLDTGSTTAVTQATAANLNATVVQATAANLNATVAQGAPNTAANAWFVKGTDGTNVETVKAASTAPIATDTALVVALSPNGAQATAANQATEIASLATIATNSANTGKTVGTIKANAPVNNQYGTTNITTAAYVQLIASTTLATNTIHAFDSSGQAMILATGGAGSEVDQYYVPPGGDTFALAIPAGTRVSYKALTANATSGYLLLDLLS